MSIHGKQAVAKVEELEGPLNSMEKRIVELEGFSAGDYDDDVGVSTSGVGQTGEFKGKTFKETVQTLISLITNYKRRWSNCITVEMLSLDLIG